MVMVIQDDMTNTAGCQIHGNRRSQPAYTNEHNGGFQQSMLSLKINSDCKYMPAVTL